MPDLSSTVSSLSKAIIGEATKIGGDLWSKIQQASKFYVRAYTQALIDAAGGVAMGDMTPEEGVNSAKAAAFFFHMMVAQATEATLAAIQKFFDAVIDTLKVGINAALPFPIL
ncbi:hypothetical protein Rleg9DRAFT_0509 [Rhizobium leguminosarum bv. trifolii WSM597]|uniref:Uncharacterized protein n=1 Tax=Rhizobium leguminosarum bv. trifolii WSM597 TaxID=754764 RepID=J0GVY9_RHILT|nr:hypothetical protein [Rhizobium leguminosarum]EJB01765.1 hypothetical protein Rleg9DRAFT_0509 [Rhizobium leguminosarum bv. trifolii WSM597]